MPWAETMTRERSVRGLFLSLEDVCRRCHFLSREQFEWMILSGSLDTIAANRRQALWSLPLLHQERGKRQKAAVIDVSSQGALDVPISWELPIGLADFDFSDSYWRQW